MTKLALATRIRFTIASFAIVLGAVCGLNSTVANAKDNGQAFAISPPLVELSADPGETVNAEIKLTNVSAGPLTMSAETNNFGSKNETGEPNIIFNDEPGQDTRYTLKDWIVAPSDFALQSKQTLSISVPITVPKNAEPGGHYAVVRFTGTSAAASPQQVSLSASIGSLILLKVSGDIKQQAKVEDFYTAGSNFDKQSFFEVSPVSFVTRIRNEGNLHIKPTGTVTIRDMFGKEVATHRINGDPSKEKEQPGSILPQSVRRFDVTHKDNLFGRYTATLDLSYGDGKTLSSSTQFWVLPYKLIIAIIVGLALLIFGLVMCIKKYNAYIIKKAAANQQPPQSKTD